MNDREILWTPSPERAQASAMAGFIRFLEETRGLRFDDYNAFWTWSTTDLDAFWQAIWDHAGVRSPTPHSAVLARRAMPGAEWFPGAQVNFAGHVLRHAGDRPDETALITHSETFGRREITRGVLEARVAAFAAHLAAHGVEQGDRVAAVLPNTDASIVAMLATARLGAIWSLCAPDMGHVAVLDRFRQIDPKVLISQDGYVHGGRLVDRREALNAIRAGLPDLAHEVMLPVAGGLAEGAADFEAVSRAEDGAGAPPPVWVPFDHPLWIVYSSGTTGNPKPIVHGHGGIILEGAKHALHADFQPGDRFCWMTSSGWIMWNVQFTAMAAGATVAQFDAAPNHPDLSALWRFAADERLTSLGVGAAFVTQCEKAGVRPCDHDLSALRTLATTGSPLTQEGYAWVYASVDPDIWLAPLSGGTDFAGAFVGGNPMLPVRAGEMQCRFLGNAVRAFDDAGREVVGEVGELVCTEPLPSMPLYLWGDEDGSRLHESYFDTYPGVWRHGDWIGITPEGGAIIHGRSDATINRRGLRLGSSEIYRAVEALPEVLDSLVVDLEFLGRESFMPLFVVLAEGTVLDQDLKDRINFAIKDTVSPRFLPNEIVQIDEVPRTLSGKKLEMPVKKLLLGHDPDQVVNRDSMANPDSFAALMDYAARRMKDASQETEKT